MIKHPSNRYERMQIKKIKEFDKERPSGRVRRFRQQDQERLDHELSELPVLKTEDATKPLA